MILLAIILLPLKYPIWALAKLRQFSHFLQQINKSVLYPFSKIQTRAPSLFPFVRCSNLHKSKTPIKYDWEGHCSCIAVCFLQIEKWQRSTRCTSWFVESGCVRSLHKKVQVIGFTFGCRDGSMVQYGTVWYAYIMLENKQHRFLLKS